VVGQFVDSAFHISQQHAGEPNRGFTPAEPQVHTREIMPLLDTVHLHYWQPYLLQLEICVHRAVEAASGSLGPIASKV